jgi:hypothetical protein
MAVEVKTSSAHPASMAERARKRLNNSGDPRADEHVQIGTGPTRTHTNIHHAGHVYDKSTAIQPNEGTSQRGAEAASTQYFTGRRSGDE